MTFLITGAGGFIGSRLAKRLSERAETVCLSTREPKSDLLFVQGRFNRFEDLRRLDRYNITCAVHLAAVTGGCSEEDGLEVNVLGTRRLIRYLLDRGCRRFVMASSIAAVGCLDDRFLPLEFPIADDHPCLATDAYGLSKSMVEEVTRYFGRIYPDAEFIHLRLGVVRSDDWRPELMEIDTKLSAPVTSMSSVLISDVIRAFEQAIQGNGRTGVHIYNVVGPDASCDAPVAEMLRHQYHGKLENCDLSYYQQAHNRYKPLFAMDKIREELGYESLMTTRPKMRLQSLS